MTTITKFRGKKKERSAHIPIIVAIALILIAVVLGKNVYILRNIVVSGNNYLSDDDVIRKAKISPGQSIFSVSVEKIEKAFDAQDSVRLVEAKVIYPDTLTLAVRECTPHAVCECAGVALVLDEYGYVIEHASIQKAYAVPRVSGLDISTYDVGRSIGCPTVGALESFRSVVQAIYSQNVASTVKEVLLHNLDSIVLIAPSGMRIKIGDRENVEEKIRLAKICYKDQKNQGNTKGTIDVSLGDKAYYSQK
ncbi:MAG: cell division protein FtsQ/DivIB [Christensenellales bacterium]|jgi:cell division septal protein FtsQ